MIDDECVAAGALDSGAVVANLGHRGLESLPNENFFLRYKAKNSYGGFISSNVICHKEGDRWVRNKLGEFSIKMGLANDCLRESIVSLEKGGPGRHNCEDYAERRFAGTDSLK